MILMISYFEIVGGCIRVMLQSCLKDARNASFKKYVGNPGTFPKVLGYI